MPIHNDNNDDSKARLDLIDLTAQQEALLDAVWDALDKQWSADEKRQKEATPNGRQPQQ